MDTLGLDQFCPLLLLIWVLHLGTDKALFGQGFWDIFTARGCWLILILFPENKTMLTMGFIEIIDFNSLWLFFLLCAKLGEGDVRKSMDFAQLCW